MMITTDISNFDCCMISKVSWLEILMDMTFGLKYIKVGKLETVTRNL